MGSTSRTGVPPAASHVAIGIMAVSVASGCAQKTPVSSFADLPDRIRPGHTVYVTDTQGEETRGRLHDLAPSALTVSATGNVMRISADRVMAIDRHGDSLWNGLAIGLGVGTAMALLADQREVPCTGERTGVCRDAQIGSRLGAIAAFGAIGTGVDALVRRRTPVYRAPAQRSTVSLSPSPRRAAVTLRLRF
jgi:hypothetical protein